MTDINSDLRRLVIEQTLHSAKKEEIEEPAVLESAPEVETDSKARVKSATNTGGLLERVLENKAEPDIEDEKITERRKRALELGVDTKLIASILGKR